MEDKTGTRAYEVYSMYENLPKTFTILAVEKTLQVRLNGPCMGDDKPFLLSANDENDKPAMVKVLRIEMDSYLDFSLKKVEYLMELEVLTILDFSGSQPGLMKARFIEVKVPRSETEVLNGSTLIPQRIKEEAEKEVLHGSTLIPQRIKEEAEKEVLHGSTLVPQQKKEAGGVEVEEYRVVYAILMPRYSTSVAKSPKFLPRNLLVQFSKLVEALNYMHLKGIVHLDIKADNIFVDAEGEWVLGDFGSCKRIDQIVGSTTPLYHYERISGQKAKPAFDYYMLLVTLLIELLPDKHDFIDALTECQGGVTRASFRKVQTAASKYKVEIPSVKNLIENLERLST
jgi:hypothetical protein